jgi:hypothetical protein
LNKPISAYQQVLALVAQLPEEDGLAPKHVASRIPDQRETPESLVFSSNLGGPKALKTNPSCQQVLALVAQLPEEDDLAPSVV